MSIRISMPANLRSEVAGRSAVEVNAGNVAEALRKLVADYPQLEPKLLDATGQPHGFINLFVNQRSIRELKGLETPLVDGDQLLLVPALAGG